MNIAADRGTGELIRIYEDCGFDSDAGRLKLRSGSRALRPLKNLNVQRKVTALVAIIDEIELGEATPTLIAGVSMQFEGCTVSLVQFATTAYSNLTFGVGVGKRR